MNIIVTGGAGFIGSHVVDKLIEHRHNVMVIDNLSFGKMENINPSAEFVKKSILDDLSQEFNSFNPDIIIHHAAQVSLRESIQNPMNDADINILGTINLLEYCKKFDVKKFIYVSSVAVYGEPEKIPIDENHPTKPTAPYGTSKLSAEKYVEMYDRMYGVQHVIFRYSNIYGPRQNEKGEAGVITIFINNLLNGKECKIFGSGEQTRDFVYVEDIANANLLALNKGKGIYVLGTGTEISVNELYNKIKSMLYNKTGKDYPKPIYTECVVGDVMRFAVDSHKAKEELGWQPQMEFDEGLDKTIEWYIKKKVVE